MRLAHSIIAVVVLLAFTAPAQADRTVDWSAYIDRSPSKPLASTPVNVVSEQPAEAKSSKSRKGKKVASKAKSKKSKVKARSKKSRRK